MVLISFLLKQYKLQARILADLSADLQNARQSVLFMQECIRLSDGSGNLVALCVNVHAVIEKQASIIEKLEVVKATQATLRELFDRSVVIH